MTSSEIFDAAYQYVVDGAEARAEDWIDEEGKHPDFEDDIFDAQLAIIETLRKPEVKATVAEATVL